MLNSPFVLCSHYNQSASNNSISVDGLTERQIAALRLLVESMKNS